MNTKEGIISKYCNKLVLFLSHLYVFVKWRFIFCDWTQHFRNRKEIKKIFMDILILFIYITYLFFVYIFFLIYDITYKSIFCILSKMYIIISPGFWFDSCLVYFG